MHACTICVIIHTTHTHTYAHTHILITHKHAHTLHCTKDFKSAYPLGACFDVTHTQTHTHKRCPMFVFLTTDGRLCCYLCFNKNVTGTNTVMTRALVGTIPLPVFGMCVRVFVCLCVCVFVCLCVCVRLCVFSVNFVSAVRRRFCVYF